MKRWVFGRDNFGYRVITDVDKDDAIMCDATYYPWTPDDDEDWRLMAAAPELHDALRNLVAAWEKGDDMVGAIEQSRATLQSVEHA